MSTLTLTSLIALFTLFSYNMYLASKCHDSDKAWTRYENNLIFSVSFLILFEVILMLAIIYPENAISQ